MSIANGIVDDRNEVWGIIENFLYGIAKDKTTEMYHVYVSLLPNKQLITEDLPYNDPKNRVNPKGFKKMYGAREFLKNYLIKDKNLPEEEVLRRILSSVSWV